MKTIADHILDIVQNSIRAKATLIEIIVVENKKKDFCKITIKDNGCGMEEAIREQATNPFFTSRNTRKVGLGLSLFKQNAERTGGSFQLISEVNKGTEVNAVFRMSNIDRPPMGDIWDTYYFTLISNPDVVLNYRHETEEGKFEMLSQEIKTMLGGVSLLQREIKEGIIEMIKNNLKEIKATN